MATVSALRVIHLSNHVGFRVIVEEHGSRIILLSGLSLTSVALLPKRKVKVVAIETNPISLTSLSITLSELAQTIRNLFHRSIIGFHYLNFIK